MKIHLINLSLIIAIILAISTFTSCEHDSLVLYEKDPDVYFAVLANERGNRGNDTVRIRFFSLATDAMYVDTSFVVNTTGKLANYDREATIEVCPTSTAIEGVHFQAPTTVTIPAGSVSGSFSVRMLRAQDLQQESKTVRLTLLLVPNSQFGTDLQTQFGNVSNPASLRSLIEMNIFANDMITRPAYWGDSYFGTFSVKKYLLISDVNGWPPSFLDGVSWEGRSFLFNGVPTVNQIIAATRMLVYLTEMENNGTPVYEDYLDEFNNPVRMTMGPNARL